MNPARDSRTNWRPVWHAVVSGRFATGVTPRGHAPGRRSSVCNSTRRAGRPGLFPWKATWRSVSSSETPTLVNDVGDPELAGGGPGAHGALRLRAGPPPAGNDFTACRDHAGAAAPVSRSA